MEISVETEKGMMKSKVSHSVSVPAGLIFLSYLALGFFTIIELATKYMSSRPVLLNGNIPWYQDLEFHAVPYLPYVLLGSLVLLVLGSLGMLAHYRKRYATVKHMLLLGTVLSILSILLYATPNISFMLMGVPSVQSNPHSLQLFYEFMSAFMLSMSFVTLFLGPSLIAVSSLPRWRGAGTMLSLMLFLLGTAISLISITSIRQFVTYEGIFNSHIISSMSFNAGQFTSLLPMSAMALVFGASVLMAISFFPIVSKQVYPEKGR